MERKLHIRSLIAVLLAGFFVLAIASPSFAASQANNSGVSMSLTGQYLGIGLWAQNQAQAFDTEAGYPTQNTYSDFLQRIRLNGAINYDKMVGGMPLASLFVQADLTNTYNGITNGFGTNGYYLEGGNPVPVGFNNDFNTFGLRQAFIRVITPVGAVMFGRLPVEFGLGVAVNTNADAIADFLPMGNIGILVGNIFGSEVLGYANYDGCTTTLGSSANCPISATTEGYYPPAASDYTHTQMGTVPAIMVMNMKPINHASYSIWLTEAHLYQFGAELSSQVSGNYSAISSISSIYPVANITFGGLSAKYSNAGTNLSGEFDYFRGDLVASSQAISFGFPYDNTPFLLGEPIFDVNNGQPTNAPINAYDIFATGSQALQTSTPVTLGVKFGMGAPISEDHYDVGYYSMIQNTRTLFGDVIGSSWQPIQFNAPGNDYLYGGTKGEAVGPILANKWVIMVDAQETLSDNNTLQESIIHSNWLKTDISGSYMAPGPSAVADHPVFGGSTIGTEFDLNFTHNFTKTISWEAWASYVATGAGVESATPQNQSDPNLSYCTYNDGQSCYGFDHSTHKNIEALGTDISWNF